MDAEEEVTEEVETVEIICQLPQDQVEIFSFTNQKNK